jgi:competence protein ComEA
MVIYFNLADSIRVNDMGLRKQIGNFFGFTRAQVNAFLILLPLLILFIFSQPVYRRLSRNTANLDFEKSKLDSLVALWDSNFDEPKADENPLFEFDPNTSTHAELIALGFSPKLANQLIGYRSKGGQFRIKQDLLKLYGMEKEFYSRLEPYIIIAQSENQSGNRPVQEKRTVTRTVERFDLNRADTTQLKLIYGIGPVLSVRIVKYRDALGGFYSKSQLFEVFGLDSVVVDRLIEQSFIEHDFVPKKININEANEVQLATHPYISRSMARAIITYRFQHGNYRSVDELSGLILLPVESFQRLKPYLKIE